MPDFLLNAWTDSNEILRVYTVHSPRSLEICIEFCFYAPLRNIFLIEHIWRFWETRHFRFRVGIGSRKWPHAVERDKLYIPSKFHSNLPCSFGGEEGSTLKKTGSESAGKIHNIFAYIRSLFWIRICDTYSGPFLSSKRFFLAATLKARFLAARTLNITHLFSGGWSQSSQIQPIDWCWWNNLFWRSSLQVIFIPSPHFLSTYSEFHG